MMCYEQTDDQLILNWDQSPWIARGLLAFGAVFDVVGIIAWLGYFQVIEVPADADWMLMLAGIAFPLFGFGVIYLALFAMTGHARFVFDAKSRRLRCKEEAAMRSTDREVDFGKIKEVVIAKSIHNDMEGIGSIALTLTEGKPLRLIDQWSMEEEYEVGELISEMVGVPLKSPFD